MPALTDAMPIIKGISNRKKGYFSNQLAAADTDAAELEEKYDITTARLEVKDTDYLDNFCFIGTINGQDTPVIIEMKNVLNMNGLNLTVADKSTGSVSLELQAHFDLSKPEEVPFKIYTPKASA